MLWVGAARQHDSAYRVAQYCFPSGAFRAADLVDLGELLSQQVRLYVGLRDRARSMSDDQVAEMLELNTLRSWFHQCNPSKAGMITLQALQNLLTEVGILKVGERRTLRR